MPLDVPPDLVVSQIEEHRLAGPGYVPSLCLDAARPPQDQARRADIVVEVVGNLPLQAKLEDVTRLLGMRQTAHNLYRRYPPTILELIRLVENNPAKPRGREWNSIGALTMRYDAATLRVTVEYCIDHCEFDSRTGAFDAGRKMVSYSALEPTVQARANKKLDDLKKYDR